MAENPLSAISGKLFDSVFSGVVYFAVAIIVIAIVVAVLYYFMIYKK